MQASVRSDCLSQNDLPDQYCRKSSPINTRRLDIRKLIETGFWFLLIKPWF